MSWCLHFPTHWFIYLPSKACKCKYFSAGHKENYLKKKKVKKKKGLHRERRVFILKVWHKWVDWMKTLITPRSLNLFIGLAVSNCLFPFSWISERAELLHQNPSNQPRTATTFITDSTTPLSRTLQLLLVMRLQG